jgi:hypothetical protein
VTSLERVELRFVLLAIFGQHGLAIIVARLSHIDPIRQNVVHCTGVPHLIFSRRRGCMGLVESLG